MHHDQSSRAPARALVAGLLGASLALAAGTPASAANLLLNSGFETGDFTNWTQGGDTGFVFANCGFLHAEGNCAAALGSTGIGTLSQSVNLDVGTSYALTFNLLGSGDNPSNFSVFLNGTQLTTLTNPNSSGAFTLYTVGISPTISANLVEFRFSDPVGFMWLDNAQLAAVPEPASAVLFGIGLAGLIAAYRRRA